MSSWISVIYQRITVDLERARTRPEKNRWMYGIFRGVYFGEYETENYKFGLVQLAVTPASVSVLKQ